VISSNEGRTALRLPGVTGLRFFSGISFSFCFPDDWALKPFDNIDPVARPQSYYRLLEIGLFRELRAVTFALTVDFSDVDVDNSNGEAFFAQRL
jgi:hypothetical protein